MRPLGFVVIEWNQASRRPSLAFCNEMYDTQNEAEELAQHMRDETARVGRRDGYTVAEVTEVDGQEESR